MHDGALDSFSVQSDIKWIDFRFTVADKLDLRVAELNLGYKFSTEAQGRTPNALRTSLHFIEMILEAKNRLVEANNTKGAKKKGRSQAKPFKIEILNLDAGKLKEKAKKSGAKPGKGKKKVSLLWLHYTESSDSLTADLSSEA